MAVVEGLVSADDEQCVECYYLYIPLKAFLTFAEFVERYETDDAFRKQVYEARAAWKNRDADLLMRKYHGGLLVENIKIGVKLYNTADYVSDYEVGKHYASKNTPRQLNMTAFKIGIP